MIFRKFIFIFFKKIINFAHTLNFFIYGKNFNH